MDEILLVFFELSVGHKWTLEAVHVNPTVQVVTCPTCTQEAISQILAAVPTIVIDCCVFLHFIPQKSEVISSSRPYPFPVQCTEIFLVSQIVLYSMLNNFCS